MHSLGPLRPEYDVLLCIYMYVLLLLIIYMYVCIIINIRCNAFTAVYFDKNIWLRLTDLLSLIPLYADIHQHAYENGCNAHSF
jgi:hypothetical protein